MSARTFSTATVATILGFAAIPFIACGGDDGNKVDSGIVVHDSSGSNGSNGSGSNVQCSAMASYTPTFGSDNSVAVNQGSDIMGFTQHDLFQGLLGTTQTDPFIDIEIVGGGGSANNPNWPTALGPKSGVDLASAPDALVAIAANFNGSGQAQDIYYATAGTLNVTAASGTTGQTFSGNISNATFTHGDFDNSGNFVPAADGCTSSIANATFNAQLQAAQFNGKTILIRDGFLHRRYR